MFRTLSVWLFFVGTAISINGQVLPPPPSSPPAPSTNAAPAPYAGPLDRDPLVRKIQMELSGPPTDDSTAQPNVPHGEYLNGSITGSPAYPGIDSPFQVYVPAQYDPAKPACFLLKLDGLGGREGTVLDNLIAKKDVPIIIGIGLSPSAAYREPPGTPNRRTARYDRSYEFDSVNDNFANFVLNELLPAVQKLKTKDGRAIVLSKDGNDHAVTGASTGGIGSFTLAWQRPDQFTRVYDVIGTFVSMRGGHEYPALIRKTDPKPLRIFLEDGSTDAWNPLFGSWYDANVNMESALKFAGYDVAHAWGQHGHNGTPGNVIFPDVMRWLWRDYPAPIKPGISQDSTLKDISVPGEGWQKIPQAFQQATGLAANPKGEVYLSDAPAHTIYRLDADNKVTTFSNQAPAILGQAFGADGTLYGVVPTEKKIIALDAQGTVKTITDGIAGHGITVTNDGTIYVSEPGEHSDMPSKIWQIKSTGEKKVIDEGLFSASGLAFATDGSLLMAAENSTKWVYSFVVQPDGAFVDKQAYFWLHMTDVINNSGAEDMAVDTNENLYVATRMGVQVCDQNGRVRAILPLPTPCGPVRSLCFGGEHFDTLYATDGTQVFTRKLKVPGYAPWSPPVPFKSQGGA